MSDINNKSIEQCKKCDLFFKEALDEAIANQHLDISQEAAFYIMGVLLFGVKKDPHTETKSMAEKYITAQHTEETERFRKIGDLCLLIAGIWWQSLLRKMVDVDYYIDIGRHCYARVSEASLGDPSDLFEELEQNFVGLANVLTETTRCISEANLSNGDILRMYEVWLRTRNTFLERKLRSLGISVIPGKTTIQ